LVKLLFFGKTFISSWLNLYLWIKPFVFSAKLPLLVKNYIFLAKPLLLNKAFLFLGKTSFFS